MAKQDFFFQKGNKFYSDKKCTKLLKLDGQTAAQWGRVQFEYEYCPECGKDLKDHLILPFNNNWFAKCLTEREEEGGEVKRAS